MKIESLENHFLRMHSYTGKDKSPYKKVNTLQEELQIYKQEANEYLIQSNEQLGNCEDTFLELQYYLNQKDIFETEEEFQELQKDTKLLKDIIIEQKENIQIYTHQAFTSTYQLFEGTLRQIVHHFKETEQATVKNAKNRRETFENYMKSKGAFPKNNSEWKRINGIYTTVYNAIKHHDANVPEKKFGQKELMNFNEKRKIRTGESILQNQKNILNQETSEKQGIILTHSLINEFIDDLRLFSDQKILQEKINEYYSNHNETEQIITLEAYKAFNDMYHAFETYMITIFESLEKNSSVQYPIRSIKKTGMEGIDMYIKKNEQFLLLNEDNNYQKIITSYKILNNRIKHNKGHLVPINEKNRNQLIQFIEQENCSDNEIFALKNNTLQIYTLLQLNNSKKKLN